VNPVAQTEHVKVVAEGFLKSVKLPVVQPRGLGKHWMDPWKTPPVVPAPQAVGSSVVAVATKGLVH
jgi:hypothetical protein